MGKTGWLDVRKTSVSDIIYWSKTGCVWNFFTKFPDVNISFLERQFWTFIGHLLKWKKCVSGIKFIEMGPWIQYQYNKFFFKASTLMDLGREANHLFHQDGSLAEEEFLGFSQKLLEH